MKKKKLTGLIALALMLLCSLCSGAWAYVHTPRDAAVDYAYEIYNYTWKTNKSVPRYHAEKSPYTVTGTIKGIPYTYANMISFEAYKALSNADRETMFSGQAKYGMVCATLVTDCIRQAFWDRDLPLLHTVMFHKSRYSSAYTKLVSSVSSSIFNYDHTKDQWQSIWSNIRSSQASSGYPAYKKLQKGDYLNDWNHVIFVVDNNTSTQTITYIDQTYCWDSVANQMVGTHKGTYTYSKLSEKCYVPMYVNYPDSFRVYLDEPPEIITTSLPDAYIGEPYYAKIEADGTEPITYTLNSSLPQSNGFDVGEMLVGSNTSGIIKGTPGFLNGTPTNRVPPYTVKFPITVDNSAGSDSRTFTVTVKERPTPPTITTTSLPDAYIGEPYYAKIEATGTAPIYFSIGNGGTTLQSNGFEVGEMLIGSNTSGIIKGTPTNPAHRATPYPLRFKVTATNSAGYSPEETFTITVKDRGIPINKTYFPDSSFRMWVSTMFDNDGDGYFSSSEIAAAKVITVGNRYVSDLTGIKYFTNLEWLECQENNIKTLDLSGLTKLKTVYCWTNKLTSLNVSGCTALTELWAYDNKSLASLHVSNCSSLKKICMWTNNTLTSLTVSKLPALEELWAAGCTALKKLYVENNPKMTLLYVDSSSALEEIHAKGSSKLSKFLLNGCSSLKTFERDSSVNLSSFKPSFTTNSLPNGYVGENYSTNIKASGIGVITYSSTATFHANGFYFAGNYYPSNTTGGIRGTPTNAATRTYTFTASNFAGSASKNLSIAVTNRGKGPKITTSSLPKGYVEVYYSFPITETGGLLPLKWEKASGTLPPGLSLSSSTGRTVYLQGKPTKTGTYTFTIRATDSTKTPVLSLPLWDSKTFTVTIGPKPAPLTIDFTFKNGVVGAWYSDYVRVSGGVAPYTWTKTDGTIPDGLVMSPDGKYLYLKGTPTKAETYTFKLRVTDALKNSVTKKFTIKITQTTIGGSLTNGVRGAAYNKTLTASGGTAPYTWDIVKGTLPPGLKLDKSTGKITGKPTKAGTYTFTVRATDANKILATKSFTVKITQTTIGGSLTNGIRGAAYSRTLTASGGTAGYTWSIVKGTLPPGLKLDKSTGKITGKPTKAGTYSFTARVKDKNGITADKSFAIKVTQTTINGTFKNGTVGQSYSSTVTLSGGTSSYKISTTGTLPAGTKITLSGTKVTVSGRPTKAASYTFTLKATDRNSIAAAKKFTIIIGRAAASAGTPDDEVPDELDTQTDNSTDDITQDGIIWGRPVQDTDGTSAAVVTVSLEVLSSDILAQGTERDSDIVDVRAGEPLTFIVSEWLEDASNVQVLVNGEPIDGVDISSEGLFTIPAEMVSGSFRVMAEAENEGFTIETEELHINAEE